MFAATASSEGSSSAGSMSGPTGFTPGSAVNMGMNGSTSVYPPQPYPSLPPQQLQQQQQQQQQQQAQSQQSQGQPLQRQLTRTNSNSNLNGSNVSGPSNAPTPQVAPANAFASPSTNKGGAKMETQSGSSSAQGASRKRGASTSPGVGSSDGSGKEKKSRADTEGSSSSNSHTRTTSTANGPTPDGRHWGEEANKLDVYVWDYLSRRGFRRAAKALLNEAGMAEAPEVPLKTPQGLLFEYWAIFWDVFAARSGRGTASATTYYDVQETKLSQRVNETARRSEAMEATFNAPPTQQARFPPVLVNGVKAEDQDSAPASTQQHNAGRPNGQLSAQEHTQTQQGQPQQQQQQQHAAQPIPQQPSNPDVARSQAMGQPQTQSPISAANPQQQPQNQQQINYQLLALAAQRHNIPLDEIPKLNPQLRASLLREVMNAQGQGGLANAPQGQMASGGGPAVGGGMDPAMMQRLQQQAMQRQMQQRGNLQAQMRPGMMAGMQQQHGPGTPGNDAQNQQGDGQRGPGPQQNQSPFGAQQQQAPMQHPQQQGQMAYNNVARPGGVQGGGGMQTFTPEQQRLLMNQLTGLQQALRTEVYQAENAATPEAKARALQNAQATQLRLTQLGTILKAQQGNLQPQSQPAVFAQQQQQQHPQMQAMQQGQQRPLQPRPQGPQQNMGQAGQTQAHQMNMMQGQSQFRPGFAPQQQAAFIAAQQQYAQQQRQGQAPGTPGQQGARPMGGPPGADSSVMMNPMAQGMGGMNGQQQVQQSPQQGADTPQRSQFAFANPFAAGAGQAGTPGSMSAGRRPSMSQEPDQSFQQPQAPYAAAQTPRSTVPQRAMSGMGPPQHISSPSPRIAQGSGGQHDGSFVGSPATIPSTPRASGAANGAPGSATERKKKEPARARKNSKAVSAAGKTPITSAASVPGASGTPSAQAQTPASVSMPTPGPDQGKNIGSDPSQQGQQSAPGSTGPTSMSVFDQPLSATGTGNDGADGGAPSGGAGNDDLSNMFGSNDMSQFLDFEFSSGSGGFGDSSAGGTGAETWDSSNFNALFGDSVS